MIKLAPTAVLAAALALAGCDGKPANTAETAAANEAAAAPKIQLPPAVKSSRQYRCSDDSVVTVNVFEGDLTANIREDGKIVLMLKAEKPGDPLVAEGGELVGTGDTISLNRPGHPKQTCRS